jgi:hypothetical protein
MTILYNPDITGLCAEVRQLRESVLRRAAAIGCEIDEASLPKAETIVDGKIAEFLSSADYHDIVARHGNDPALRLLVRECAQSIFAAIPTESTYKAPTRGSWRHRRPDLRVVTERER